MAAAGSDRPSRYEPAREHANQLQVNEALAADKRLSWQAVDNAITDAYREPAPAQCEADVTGGGYTLVVVVAMSPHTGEKYLRSLVLKCKYEGLRRERPVIRWDSGHDDAGVCPPGHAHLHRYEPWDPEARKDGCTPPAECLHPDDTTIDAVELLAKEANVDLVGTKVTHWGYQQMRTDDFEGGDDDDR